MNDDNLGYIKVCTICRKGHWKKSVWLKCQEKDFVNWIRVESRGATFLVNRFWFDRMKPLGVNDANY